MKKKSDNYIRFSPNSFIVKYDMKTEKFIF
jgi:hypothetical protein